MRACLVALVAGCGSEPGAPCPATPYDCTHAHDAPVEIEVGTGDSDAADFEPLPVDGVLPLYEGPQGGYHVYLQTRMRGLCPNAVEFLRTLREPEGGTELRRQSTRVRLVDAGDGWWIFPRAQVTFVCPPETPGVDMAGRTLRIDVDLTDIPGCRDDFEPRAGTATATILPTCPIGDAACAGTGETGCAAR